MNDPAADTFLDHFAVSPDRPDRDLLFLLAHLFARLPYENLSKLVAKFQQVGSDRLRLPQRVIADHMELGSGGTCFSLTELFMVVLQRAGFSPRPVLCDMRHRPDNHCALLVGLHQAEYLLDPAYLLAEPLLLARPGYDDRVIERGPVRLEAVGDDYQLHTHGKWRYRLKTAQVSSEQFRHVWAASFDWNMMNNVHMSRAEGQGYAYVHGHKLRLAQPEQKSTVNIRGREAEELSRRFGIDPGLIERAYRLARGRGDDE